MCLQQSGQASHHQVRVRLWRREGMRSWARILGFNCDTFVLCSWMLAILLSTLLFVPQPCCSMPLLFQGGKRQRGDASWTHGRKRFIRSQIWKGLRTTEVENTQGSALLAESPELDRAKLVCASFLGRQMKRGWVGWARLHEVRKFFSGGWLESAVSHAGNGLHFCLMPQVHFLSSILSHTIYSSVPRCRESEFWFV